MKGMFKSYKFNQDISIWDISSVKISYMFNSAASFSQNLSAWDFSSVKIIEICFQVQGRRLRFWF